MVQEVRIDVLRLSRIEEGKIYRPFRCRVIDDRKKLPWQFSVGGCSLFVETGGSPNSMRTIQVLLDSDKLREIGKSEMAMKYGTMQRSFVVNDLNMLD